MEHIPKNVQDRIDYHYEAYKILNEELEQERKDRGGNHV